MQYYDSTNFWYIARDDLEATFRTNQILEMKECFISQWLYRTFMFQSSSFKILNTFMAD